MQASFYAVRVHHPSVVPGGDEAALARRVVDAAPGRDIAAEAELYRRLAPRARLYGLKHLRDDQAAADLAQDVLLMALDRLRKGEVREPAQITSFVLGTCRQLVIDRKRGVQRRQRISETYADDLQPAEVPESPTLDTQQLHRCLHLLPERERSVIVMTFFQDNDANEVAQALGLSSTNVRVIRHRAVERLRNCVDGGRESDA